VSNAVRWITDHFDEPFQIDELSRSSGMSASAFHRNFRAVTGLSPIAFRQEVRLQNARLLLIAGLDVATAGTQVGYRSLPQFNREYRRRFGLPPGRDATRLRVGGSAGT
jgi:AraC-like DNA-binding protein